MKSNFRGKKDHQYKKSTSYKTISDSAQIIKLITLIIHDKSYGKLGILGGINDHINLIGLDDSESNPDLAITKKLPANKLNIALFHTPSLI